jgi:hypothetical protein
MPPITSSSRPVAETMMSAAISSPLARRTPHAVRRAICAGHDPRRTAAQGLEKVAVGHQAQALVPGVVARREVSQRRLTELIADTPQQQARTCCGARRVRRYSQCCRCVFFQRVMA